MITFEEAKNKAEKLNSGVNACIEYDKGYRFFDENSDADGDAGVVIVKETGESLDFVQFILKCEPSPEYKKISMV